MGENAFLHKDCHEGYRCFLMDKLLEAKVVKRSAGKSFRNILKEKNLNVMSWGIFCHCLNAEGAL